MSFGNYSSTSSTSGATYEIREWYWNGPHHGTAIWETNTDYVTPYANRIYKPRAYQNRLVDDLYSDRSPRRTAHAVPPGPPPVPIEMASETVRSAPRYPMPAVHTWSASPPRRHERQSTCIRSRRKLRTWERT